MVLLHTITHPSRIHDIKFCKRVTGDGEVLLVAAEDKKVSIYELPEDREKVPTIIAEMIGHENRCAQFSLLNSASINYLFRVKAVDALSIALPSIPSHPEARSSTTVVSTISSDGKVRLFDLASVLAGPSLPGSAKAEISAVAEYDTKGSRLTCMAMADGEIQTSPTSQSGKRKREEAEEEVEEEQDDVEGDGTSDEEEENEEDEDEN